MNRVVRNFVGPRSVTYREVWRRARVSERRGGYPRGVRRVGPAYRDLVRATSWFIRPALRLTVLGYGEPSIADVARETAAPGGGTSA